MRSASSRAASVSASSRLFSVYARAPVGYRSNSRSPITRSLPASARSVSASALRLDTSLRCQRTDVVTATAATAATTAATASCFHAPLASRTTFCRFRERVFSRREPARIVLSPDGEVTVGRPRPQQIFGLPTLVPDVCRLPELIPHLRAVRILGLPPDQARPRGQQRLVDDLHLLPAVTLVSSAFE